MGEVRKGYCGPFTGKMGPGVGTYINGRNIIKSLPIPSKKTTESQREQRAIFKLAANFVEVLAELLPDTFTKRETDGPVFSEAVKQVITEAISGTPPVINYGLVKISRGKLKNATTSTVTVAPGTLTFNWTTSLIDSRRAASTDKVILVAYCDAVKFAEYTINGPTRSTGTAVLILPDDFTGQLVQTWISFISADGKKSADSKFLGAVTAL
jgi:hypothetical protein